MSLLIVHTNFEKEIKKVLKQNITTNENTLNVYKGSIAKAYNAYIQQVKLNYNRYDISFRTYIDNQIEQFKVKLIKAYQKLETRIQISEDLLAECTVLTDDFIKNNIENNFEENNSNIADLSNPEFLKIAAATVNKPYSGDPLALQSFIDSIELLATLATTAGLRTFLVSFIKTKIEGRAREYITDQDITTENIVQKLSGNIKPESSKVIEGRMLALRVSNSTQVDFSAKAEDLAEAFRRSLVIEGIIPSKANEMAVEKTVELCRLNTQSDLVIQI